MGIALRKGEEKLKGDINAALSSVMQDGTYKTISAKYFDFDIMPKPAQP